MTETSWTDTFLAVAIAIISFGIGLNLKFKDFKKIILYPKAILTGLVSQIVLLPAIAFLIIAFWPIDPIYKVGFILIAACPGGTTSNLVTFFLKGNVPLSVSLTAFNSIIILFTIPLFIDLGFRFFLAETETVNLSFMTTFSEILYSVIVPVAAGISLNEITSKNLAEKLQKTMRYLMTALLIAAVVVVLWFDENEQASHIESNLHLFIPLLVLNAGTMIVGYYFPSFLKLDHETRYTISIEMGLQNTALALFIANNVLRHPEMSLMAIIYGSFSLFTTFGIAYIMKNFMTPHASR